MKKDITRFGKLLAMLVLALSFTVLMVGCSCDSEEAESTESASETEAAIILPEDEFEDYTEDERIKMISDDLDKIAKLQEDGVTTDEQKAEYDEAVKDLEEKAPELKDIVDAGKDDYSIDTDSAKKVVEEESVAASEEASKKAETSTTASADKSSDSTKSTTATDSTDASVGTDEDGNVTLPYGDDPIELPTIKF